MAMLQNDAVSYYHSRAQHFRHQADQVTDQPQQAKLLRELALLFEKEARALDHALNALPDASRPY